jgi:hypothetical protein
LNVKNPSAGRNQVVRSQEYKVRPIREHSAIAASKVCRPYNDQNRFQDPHLFRGQRLLVVAVSAAAAVVAAAIVQASKDVDFYSHDFPKQIIADENKPVHIVAPDFAARVRSWSGSACARAVCERAG